MEFSVYHRPPLQTLIQRKITQTMWGGGAGSFYTMAFYMNTWIEIVSDSTSQNRPHKVNLIFTFKKLHLLQCIARIAS